MIKYLPSEMFYTLIKFSFYYKIGERLFSKISPKNITVSMLKEVTLITPVEIEQNHLFSPNKQINGSFML